MEPQGAHRISRAFTAVRGADGKVQIVENEKKRKRKQNEKRCDEQLRGSSSSEKKKVKESGDGDDYTGAWASVVKTTDGGETWSVVHSTAPRAATTPTTSTASTVVLRLRARRFPFAALADPHHDRRRSGLGDLLDGPTVMPVRMVGKTEAWAGGQGPLWHTTDLKTWDKQARR